MKMSLIDSVKHASEEAYDSIYSAKPWRCLGAMYQLQRGIPPWHELADGEMDENMQTIS